ncbi:MAG: aldehyde ferredoxin oxidoreductase family protein [Thermoproteales archaeon]|nr:aldehyde ferredoxin oxidoreductase family protein [Thermoproteales archaeon]
MWLPRHDPIKNVLYIDLTLKKFWVEDRSDLFEEYMGGTGVAIKLLEEEIPRNADPLGPDNVIVFAIGPFNGVYPAASKTVAMFKSPHTGNLGESHAGGRSSIAIRLAGYGAIVIKGTSSLPIWVSIRGKNVVFNDARALWGMRSSYTVGRIIRENEPNPGFRTIMRIGRAGEKLITYAGVITETYRHFGRLGLGAVFGSKKLKALVVSGRGSIPISNKREYRKIYKELYDTMVKSPVMKKYHDIGTPVNVLRLNEIGALPTKNLKATKFENADILSGENLAKGYLARRMACSHCPVACIHLAALREPYVDEPFFYKTTFVSYDYEPIFALGSMLGAKSVDGFLKLLDMIETYGLDAMSSGVVLAWITEAFERGLIGEKELLGEKPKWGDHETYMRIIDKLVEQPNDFYKAIGKGCAYASRIYGGEDFALTFGGNEMPGYHTGPAAPYSFMVGARHSHLDSAGYSLDEKTIGKELTEEEIVDKLLEEERWRQVLTSLVVCLFARGVYKPEIIVDAFKAFGLTVKVDDLYELGKKIHMEKYKFKIREGFDLDKYKFPKRIFETPTPHGYLSEEKLVKMKRIFKEKIINEIKPIS